MSAAELVLLVAANVLGAAMSLPQAVRLLRTQRVDGVSLGWAAMSVATNGWWLVYGLSSANWAIVPVSVDLDSRLPDGRRSAVMRFGTRQAALLGRAGAGALAASVVVPALVLAFGGLVSLGVALGTDLRGAVGSRRSGRLPEHDLSGVSAGTWLAAWAEAALWGALGLRAGDPGLVALALYRGGHVERVAGPPGPLEPG